MSFKDIVNIIHRFVWGWYIDIFNMEYRDSFEPFDTTFSKDCTIYKKNPSSTIYIPINNRQPADLNILFRYIWNIYTKCRVTTKNGEYVKLPYNY